MTDLFPHLREAVKQAQAALDHWKIDPETCNLDYNECLDADGPVYAGGIPFETSRILGELDPTAYRCGLVDYVDSLDKSDFAEYQELERVLEDAEFTLEEAIDAKEGDA